MKAYTIGNVEKILRVKDYVIRYWEREVPLLRPAKDTYGRRVYSARDIELLLRLKYLLYERRFTLEGAREELLRELSGAHQDLRGSVSALRSRLLDLYFLIEENRRTGTGT
jgi:DNA-binding transcriptional MerR regulator